MSDPSAAFPGRVLAIDWGLARIGLAVSDPTRTLATPHQTLHEKDKGQQVKRVVALIGELEVTHVIVGLPLHADGNASESTRSALRYAEKLQTLVPVQVELVDERLTSVLAEEYLAEAGRLPRGKPSTSKAQRERDRGLIDSAAAAVLLQQWLDRQPRPAEPQR